MISWLTLYPDLYQSERKRVERTYRNLDLCTSALEQGVLQYHGEIVIRGSQGTKRQKILFTYPSTFPYQLPTVKPVQALPDAEPHPAQFVAVIKNARHQMASGALCLIEPDPFRKSGEIVRGVDVLRRAEAWFFAVDSGTNPYDSPEADLEAHMNLLGQILIGPEFYDTDLQVGGSFYATFAWGTSDLARFLGLAISSDLSNLIVFRDSRKTLEWPFPWVRSDLWNAAERIAQGRDEFGDLEKIGVIKGIWWDLPREPPPPRSGRDLLTLVGDAGSEATIPNALNIIRASLAKERYAFLAFRFPNRKGQLEWLFTAVKLRDEAGAGYVILSDDQKRVLVEQSAILALRSHPLLPRSLMLRNERRVPKGLTTTSIALLGSGALGSAAGDLLAKAGVGGLFVFDKDLMEVGNAIRHIAGIESFGLQKADASALSFVQHNPFSDIRVSRDDLLSSFETIELALTESDFAISTIADESVESAVNEVATRMRKPVYYARALRGGASARIFRVIPGRDACRYCVSHYIRQRESPNELGEWLNVLEDEDNVLSFECGNPIIASSGADLSLIASLTVKVVLDDVDADFGSSNHWLWTTEKIEDHPALSEAYKLHARCVSPFPGCPFCSDPPVQKVLIPATTKAFMIDQALSAKGNEVCGILIGYFKKDRIVQVIDASDAGPNAKSTPAGCWRDVEYVQKWIDKRLERGDEQLRYVGEWHSHPSLDTRPSHVDVESLNGIAASQTYMCQTPVMIVLGTSDQGEEKLSAYSFAVGRPYKEVAWESMDDASAITRDEKSNVDVL